MRPEHTLYPEIAALRSARREVAARGAASRMVLTELTRNALVALWHEVFTEPTPGMALATVGSLGRGDPGPEADLDLIFLHDGKRHAEDLAARLWYPIWDSHLELDHSVRTPTACVEVAHKDIRAALALLDMTFIAGDESLVASAREKVFRAWRKEARLRLDSLLDSARERHQLYGNLAYRIEGDLKEARGGLRDHLLIRGLTSTWLAQAPDIDTNEAYSFLLDVRDTLAGVTGKHKHILRIDLHDEVARRLGYTDSARSGADQLLGDVSRAARRIDSALAETIRRAEHANAPAAHVRRRLIRGRVAPPAQEILAEGVALNQGELVLAEPRFAQEPQVLFSLMRLGAQRGLPIRPKTLTNLESGGAGRAWQHGPWPEQARADFLATLASGRRQIPVWEALDVAGLLTQLCPPWEKISYLPQRSAIHIHTVDRHQYEVAALVTSDPEFQTLPQEAREVASLAAFFHDIGKELGHPGHAPRSAAIAEELLTRIGFAPNIVGEVKLMIASHLLLGELSKSADPRNVQTQKKIAEACGGSLSLLPVLMLLSRCDSAACKEGTWDEWKAQIYMRLAKEAEASGYLA